MLSSPTDAAYLFYGLIIIAMIAKVRPWRMLGWAVAGLIAFGYAAHAIVGAIAPVATAGSPGSPGWIGSVMNGYVIVPKNPTNFGNVLYLALIVGLVAIVRLRGVRQLIAVIITIYVAACCWESRLIVNPAITTQIMLGAILIVTMAARPYGLSGQTPRGARLTMALLEIENLSLSFGGLRAISELNIDVNENEIVSVIGPNGAGKSSVFNVISGIYDPTDGDIRLGGESIIGKKAHTIARMGIARTFQSLRLFQNLSVKENVKAATYGNTKASPPESILRLPRARREEREIDALATEVLSFFGERLAGYRWDQPAYVLSYANRRRLEIARALATRPRLLMLDEPAAGMNPKETHEITELIARLRDELKLAILVIEHDMHVVEGISDRVVALDHGVKITEGSFNDVATHPAVIEAYLGRDPEALAEA